MAKQKYNLVDFVQARKESTNVEQLAEKVGMTINSAKARLYKLRRDIKEASPDSQLAQLRTEDGEPIVPAFPRKQRTTSVDVTAIQAIFAPQETQESGQEDLLELETE